MNPGLAWTVNGTRQSDFTEMSTVGGCSFYTEIPTTVDEYTVNNNTCSETIDEDSHIKVFQILIQASNQLTSNHRTQENHFKNPGTNAI